MNRLFAFVLLLIVTAATVTPCCVYDNCSDEEITITDGGQNEDDGEGTCSPFFSCASCPGFVWYAKPVQIAEPTPGKTVHFARLNTHSPQTVYSSFWQPPRVA